MTHLRAVGKKPGGWPVEFPFCVPTIRELSRVEFASPVTILVGENGTGKSTFLEALASGIGAITLGGEDAEHDASLSGARRLSAHLKFEWRKKTGRGFFLRAEDVFGFVRRINATGRELEALVAGYDEELKLRPDDEGIKRAKGYMLGQRASLAGRYGADADAHSHGETFLNLFEQRITPNGLYLLDEPEAALSPLRQLAFLSLMKAAAAQNCQFIFATHSPMLMAFPDANILSFDTSPIAPVAYDDLENVRLMRAFLNDPATFVRRL